MKRILSRIGIWFLLAVLSIGAALPAYAANDTPVTLTAQADPELALSQAGTISYIRFTLTNNSNVAYILYNATLAGDLIDGSAALDATVAIMARESREFTLNDLRIEEDQFDTPLQFTLTWDEIAYGTDDPLHQHPITTKRTSAVSITIERYIKPEIVISAATDALLYSEGALVTVTYTLHNPSKFDMTGLVLYEQGTNLNVPMSQTILLAGESLAVPYTFSMPTNDVVLQPTVSYTVRNEQTSTILLEPVTLSFMLVQLELEVQSFSPTEEGTRFAVTVRNTGTQLMSALQVYDEINTPVGEPFDLSAGGFRTVEYTIPSATGMSKNRFIHFHIVGKDATGADYSYYDTNTYEVIPYIEAGLVDLTLAAALTELWTDADGKVWGRVSFEIVNSSEVVIENAAVTELDSGAILASYDALSKGRSKFTYEFELDGLSYLRFALSGYDTAGTLHSAAAVTISLDEVWQRLQSTATPAAEEQSTDDSFLGRVTNTLRRVILVILAIVVAALIAIGALYISEQKLRERLPRHTRPAAHDTAEEPLLFVPSESVQGRGEAARVTGNAQQFGYVPPAKLRYTEQGTTRYAPIPAAEHNTGNEQRAAKQSSAASATRITPMDKTRTLPGREELRKAAEANKEAAKTAEKTKQAEAPLFDRKPQTADAAHAAPVGQASYRTAVAAILADDAASRDAEQPTAPAESIEPSVDARRSPLAAPQAAAPTITEEPAPAESLDASAPMSQASYRTAVAAILADDAASRDAEQPTAPAESVEQGTDAKRSPLEAPQAAAPTITEEPAPEAPQRPAPAEALDAFAPASQASYRTAVAAILADDAASRDAEQPTAPAESVEQGADAKRSPLEAPQAAVCTEAPQQPALAAAPQTAAPTITEEAAPAGAPQAALTETTEAAPTATVPTAGVSPVLPAPVRSFELRPQAKPRPLQRQELLRVGRRSRLPRDEEAL